jgi:hypothetical protein
LKRANSCSTAQVMCSLVADETMAGIESSLVSAKVSHDAVMIGREWR